MNPEFGITRNYTSTGAIGRRRLVAHTANQGELVQASGTTDKICGVSGIHAASAAGKRIDAHHSGLHEVDYGGPVAPGDPITSDANGKGVVANPGAGVQVRIVGFATEEGEDGSYGQVLIAPQIITG